MDEHRTYPLGTALRRRAEAFFRCDFSDVGLRVEDTALGPGVAAMATGDTIYLSSSAAGLTRPRLAALLGHELAHLVQQRQGRARPCFRHGELAICDDPALEREADELGARFVHAPHDRPPAPGARRPAPRVGQRSVFIAGRPLHAISSLAESTRACLGFIPHGVEWLDWAIDDTGQAYGFADEEQLAVATAVGLHASALVRLPTIGLIAGAARLVQLPPASLQVLAAAEHGSASPAVALQLKSVCARERLALRSDLDLGAQFLIEVGVQDAAVFQAMSLADRIAIYELVEAVEASVAMRPELQREAAVFATSQAATPLEFTDYYKVFLGIATKLDLLDGAAEARARAAQTAVDTLRPLLYGAVTGVHADGFVPPAALQQRIRNVQRAGKQVGFERLSASIAQLVQHTVFKDQRGDAARSLVQGFLAEANTFVVEAQPDPPALAQDGERATYPLHTERLRGELAVDSTGTATLSFVRPPDSPTSAPPPAVTPLGATSAPPDTPPERTPHHE